MGQWQQHRVKLDMRTFLSPYKHLLTQPFPPRVKLSSACSQRISLPVLTTSPSVASRWPHGLLSHQCVGRWSALTYVDALSLHSHRAQAPCAFCLHCLHSIALQPCSHEKGFLLGSAVAGSSLGRALLGIKQSERQVFHVAWGNKRVPYSDPVWLLTVLCLR